MAVVSLMSGRTRRPLTIPHVGKLPVGGWRGALGPQRPLNRRGEREVTPTGLRLKVRWDDWRAVAVRRWCKNPTGKQWSDMRIETLIREGVIEADEPPDLEVAS